MEYKYKKSASTFFVIETRKNTSTITIRTLDKVKNDKLIKLSIQRYLTKKKHLKLMKRFFWAKQSNTETSEELCEKLIVIEIEGFSGF